MIAPTGFGKSHLAFELLEGRQYVLVLATKRADPLVSELSSRGYTIVGSLEQIPWAWDPDPSRRRPVHEKVVYWPQLPENIDSDRRVALLSKIAREALDWAEKTGRWTVLIDETMFLADQLRLEKALNMLWYQGRSHLLSVMALAQRPSRVPRLAFSQASYLFLGRFGDKRDLETLRDLNSTIPRDVMEETVRTLSKAEHEFLFVDCARDELEVVVAPAR